MGPGTYWHHARLQHFTPYFSSCFKSFARMCLYAPGRRKEPARMMLMMRCRVLNYGGGGLLMACRARHPAPLSHYCTAFCCLGQGRDGFQRPLARIGSQIPESPMMQDGCVKWGRRRAAVSVIGGRGENGFSSPFSSFETLLERICGA